MLSEGSYIYIYMRVERGQTIEARCLPANGRSGGCNERHRPSMFDLYDVFFHFFLLFKTWV